MTSERLERALRERLRGEVRFDETSRLLYSTDASLYQIIPIGVVIPRDENDVVATVKVCAEQRVPILPRGSGTSLGGQTVGAAVVMDFSKYMNRIEEVNAEAGWARVQPGVILDELNAHLRPLRLQFAPDVATSNRASLGGMIGNNSCGAHSVIYGKTVDHVQELAVVLSDGQLIVAGEAAKTESTAGRLTKTICALTESHRDEILARFPKILRRVGGYNLDRFLSEEDQAAFAKPRLHRDSSVCNLAKIIVGSEGTLGALTEATINLVPLPTMTALCVAHFDDLYKALEAAPLALQCEPSAVELTDKFILDLTKQNLAFAQSRQWIQGDPAAVLMIEFYGESQEELRDQIANLKSRISNLAYGFHDAYAPSDQSRAYDIRKSGLGLLMGLKGEAKPQGFIEDTAVAPEQLASYIRRLTKIMQDHGCSATYYAHASVGCLHVRPVMSLKSRDGIARMRSICSQACDLVLEYGGSFSSEHGDGLVRSEFIERAYGPQLYEAFKQVKRAFDPLGLMNPGKIVDAPAMTQNLRLERATSPKLVPTYFNWDRDGGLMGHLELCSGLGACRKKLEGTMCPSYRATMDEKDTTRARANLFRSVMTGEVKADGLASDELRDVLDLCLECKACKSECPSNLDMAKLKVEFLAHYHERRGASLRTRLLANIASANRALAPLAPLANAVMNSGANRWLLAHLGIDSRRPLPQLARETFAQWFRRTMRSEERAQTGQRVLLLNDTFTNYNDPRIGIAAVRVLEAVGCRVALADMRCCGRPLISKGMLKKAKARAQANLTHLNHQLDGAQCLVGLEPSCVSAITDDYLDLVGGARARGVAERTMMIEDFVARTIDSGPHSSPFSSYGSVGRDGEPVRRGRLLFHGHCHQKALLNPASTPACLRHAGYDVAEIPSGCCGMAGSFGYESEHYDLSMQIGELILFPAVRSAGPDGEIVAEGTSCRHQIAHGTGRVARHPIELLAEALVNTKGEVR